LYFNLLFARSCYLFLFALEKHVCITFQPTHVNWILYTYTESIKWMHNEQILSITILISILTYKTTEWILLNLMLKFYTRSCRADFVELNFSQEVCIKWKLTLLGTVTIIFVWNIFWCDEHITKYKENLFLSLCSVNSFGAEEDLYQQCRFL
jgi:hypothetical protein